jgi:hypothetical protein
MLKVIYEHKKGLSGQHICITRNLGRIFGMESQYLGTTGVCAGYL